MKLVKVLKASIPMSNLYGHTNTSGTQAMQRTHNFNPFLKQLYWIQTGSSNQSISDD